jgi:hypothetical protein
VKKCEIVSHNFITCFKLSSFVIAILGVFKQLVIAVFKFNKLQQKQDYAIIHFKLANLSMFRFNGARDNPAGHF